MWFLEDSIFLMISETIYLTKPLLAIRISPIPSLYCSVIQHGNQLMPSIRSNLQFSGTIPGAHKKTSDIMFSTSIINGGEVQVWSNWSASCLTNLACDRYLYWTLINHTNHLFNLYTQSYNENHEFAFQSWKQKIPDKCIETPVHNKPLIHKSTAIILGCMEPSCQLCACVRVIIQCYASVVVAE